MRVRQGARKVLVCLISTRLSVHGFTCVVVADDEEREGGLVLQAAVLRPAEDDGKEGSAKRPKPPPTAEPDSVVGSRHGHGDTAPRRARGARHSVRPQAAGLPLLPCLRRLCMRPYRVRPRRRMGEDPT
jgi:hypothetical protein